MLSPELKEYYDSNRLRVGSLNSALGFLAIISETIIDPEIKSKLKDISSRLPKEITDLDEDGFLRYHNLSDEEKIVGVKKITNLISEVLDCLEVENKN